MTQQTRTHQRDRCRGQVPGGVLYNRQVKCHSQGGQNKRPLEGRVKAPTRTNGPPNSVRDRGPSNLKRGRQGHRHTVSIAGCYTGRCRDYKPFSRQSPGSARRGRYVNPASSTANVQGRKAQTDVPVRESQGANQDEKTTKHTAIARGLKQPKARKTGPMPHYVYRRKP